MPGGPRRRDAQGGGAARCSICGISYPPFIGVCRGCDENTDFISNAKPDEDWGDQAARIRELRGEDAIEDAVPMRKCDPDGITRVNGRVVVHDGQYFIAIGDVVGSGYYEPLDTFDIIQIGKHYFEVVGLSDALRAYLVRYFPMTPTDEDMAWLAHEGDSA
jgi:hypothetical protein